MDSVTLSSAGEGRNSAPTSRRRVPQRNRYVELSNRKKHKLTKTTYTCA